MSGARWTAGPYRTLARPLSRGAWVWKVGKKPSGVVRGTARTRRAAARAMRAEMAS